MKEFSRLSASHSFPLHVGSPKIRKYIKIKFFLVNCFDPTPNGIRDNSIEAYRRLGDIMNFHRNIFQIS